MRPVSRWIRAAPGTLIAGDILQAVGYDITAATDFVTMTTGSGTEQAPRLPVAKLASLGQEQANFPVVVHSLLPPSIVDGLLGLDFFRLQILILDFRAGEISLR